MGNKLEDREADDGNADNCSRKGETLRPAPAWLGASRERHTDERLHPS